MKFIMSSFMIVEYIVTVQARRSLSSRICRRIRGYIAVALVDIPLTELSLSACAGGWSDGDPTLLACDNIHSQKGWGYGTLGNIYGLSLRLGSLELQRTLVPSCNASKIAI